MGKIIHLGKIEALFEKSPVVSFKSIERIIGKKKNSSYAKLLVSNLIRKKRIMALAKGFYTKHNEISLAVYCFKPAYLGLQSALSHHKVWEQETIPIILTSNNVRVGTRIVGGNNVQIRKIDKRHFFGFDYAKEDEFYIPYSDLEKTFIDMVVFQQDLPDEMIKVIGKRIDKLRLSRYLKSYSQKTQNNVRQRILSHSSDSFHKISK